GCKVLGVSGSLGAAYNPLGLDLQAALAYYGEHKMLKGFPGGESITNEELLEADCDILIPAALGNAITLKNASKIRAQIVIEGANDCTEADADEVLRDRGIFVVPDILANAGGVVFSYFEWGEKLHNHYWGIGQVLKRIQEIM